MMHVTLASVLVLLGAALGSPKASEKFPDDFIFGAASAAYQVEGAWQADGKGENIWDHLVHGRPNWTFDHQNGDVAADSYHLYKEDVKALKEMGMDFYRFSISWSRILPTGDVDVINQQGINYYNNLINELLLNGIYPVVTMYHWDLPQGLQELGGWVNPTLVDYFQDYARILFNEFGDRVKLWITFNEPLEFTSGYGLPYDWCGQAPCIDKHGVGEYLATHTVLIAHARVYHMYVDEFKVTQKGKVGITLNINWKEPLTNSTEDIEAAHRSIQFSLGWFAHPIFSREGDYPSVMRERVDANSRAEGRTRSRLPIFSKELVEYIRGTSDFFGLNHYTSDLSFPGEIGESPSRLRDSGVNEKKDPSWPGAASSWLKVVPWGFRKILKWISREYDNPPILVTENGFSDHGELNDTGRINYLTCYLAELARAINVDEVNVFGYTAWSVIDNFEWGRGYSERFGVYHVNFSDPSRPRKAKASSKVLAQIVRTKEVPADNAQCTHCRTSP